MRKSVALPTFSGKDKDYAVFWPRFYSYAMLKGFDEVLDNTNSPLPADPTSLSSNDDLKKKQERAIKLNNLAVASFTMAFTTGTLMEHVEKSKSSEYPGGRANLIVDRLKRKFRPTDRILGIEAEKELMKLKFGKKDPDEYFDKLAALKNNM